ncbi:MULTISPECIES: L,D-transpeptidase family protein [unclassified Lysobacter]|uniref:L,D-transpeptidase family protein n=2 Tax=Lysobacter TaxID=68 RepID=UPI0006FFEC70|nr:MULTISPECIES: L,D-transpeptidase family protein [unclassified Lysobacter]KQZ56883.1 hypothetical protein ASD53_10325 [Lysobacter sp. Root559]KRC34727.1 hypothetical protein ASE10_08480 [Lysobacter sp. Root76]KRD70415.1 hypothetical protein ASE45_00645 [Lysobacter sp. Root96]
MTQVKSGPEARRETADMTHQSIAAIGSSWLALLAIPTCLFFSNPSPALASEPDQTPLYEWQPQLAPEGPVTIVVRIPQQTAYVYRNGVRIGRSHVSTGRPGYQTPAGVFAILEKQREHYSNLYDDAPMPYMQRLTWNGFALHAGSLPGYPASHGCIRLPYSFAEKLFAITSKGTTVIVSDTTAPAAAAIGDPFRMAPVVGDRAAEWHPERSAVGPVAVILSLSDRELVVLRNSLEIGRAPVAVFANAWRGTHAYVRLPGDSILPSSIVPDRPALKWLEIPLTPDAASANLNVLAESLQVDTGFAAQAYDVLAPGSTLIVTDEPISAGPDTTLILAGTPMP